MKDSFDETEGLVIVDMMIFSYLNIGIDKGGMTPPLHNQRGSIFRVRIPTDLL